MSLAAYIAFYSNDIQRREDAALVCKRTKGNEYKVQDDAWALDFYYAHKDDSAEELVKAVLSNKDMWDQDLTEIKGLEELIVADLKKTVKKVQKQLTLPACKINIANNFSR